MSDNVPWALKYRPRKFTDITGQHGVRLVLQRMISTGDIRPSLLLHGSLGSGKTSTARIIAAALNCESEDPASRPCGDCSVCLSTAQGRSSDVTEIDAASSGLVEDMRALRESVRFAAQSQYRIVILDECHELTARGFQTLLKTLEEPPANTVFILATTSLDKVPDTIASRCLSLEFRRLTESQIAGRLRQIAECENMELSQALAQDIASRSRGIARDAVSLLEQCHLVCIKTPEQLATLLGDVDYGVKILRALVGSSSSLSSGVPHPSDFSGAFGCIEEALSSLPSPQDVVASMVRSLKRIMILTTGGNDSILSPPATSAELALAGQLDSARCVASMRVVWEYYSKIAPAADSYAAMDLLVTLLSQVLNPAARVSGRTGSADLSSMVRT